MRHTWTPEKNIVSHILSFPSINYSPRVGCLVGYRVGCCVVVMLLSFSSFTLLPCCQHCRRRHHRRHAGTLPPPPLPSVSVEVDACYTNADSSPDTLAHAVCRAPTEGWWQRRGRGGGDRALDYNEGVGCYPIVWGVEGARGERDLIVVG